MGNHSTTRAASCIMAVNVMSRTVKYSPSQQIAYGDTAAKSEASYDSWFDDPGLLSNAAYNLAVDNGLAFFLC